MPEIIPTTTVQTVKPIAHELEIDEEIVRRVLEAYAKKIREALRAELPFAISHVGKLYFRYAGRKPFPGSKNAEFYKDKVRRELQFIANDSLRAEFNHWIHDVGTPDNQERTLLRLKIAPDEIGKIIKKKLLDEQRKEGFRPELLFDNLPDSEVSVLKDLGEAPSMDAIYRRIQTMMNDESDQ